MKSKNIVRRPIVNDDHLTQLHPVIARIYAARGIADPNQLSLDMTDLFSFDQLHQMAIAVKRLHQALIAQERILIVGDFDADGATSTAIAVSALRLFGAKHVDFLVPNRFDYGYGLSKPLVEDALVRAPNLIITVDNGISSIEGVAHAYANGIDVVITDHHLPAEQLPAAVAIINPNQNDCAFPSKHLAGCGVIFYVMVALRRHLIEQDWFAQENLAQPNLASLLDYVALGTIADVVTLDQNNRILVYQGLQRIRRGHCAKGILALLKVANRELTHLTATDLAFAVAPRLNAAGRLDDMSIGIRCLLSNDADEAMDLAQQLNDFNIERRAIEATMQVQATNIITALAPAKGYDLPYAFALYDPSWHQGVVGIVAGRVKEKYHRPTFAFANETDTALKGSGRSIPGLHLRDILVEVDHRIPGVIKKFGGHAMAAGLTLDKINLVRFREALETVVSERADKAMLEAFVMSDGPLMPDQFTLDLAQQIREAGPFGQGFPEPLFDGEFTVIEQRLLSGNHLKCTLQPDNSAQYLDAIAFNVDNTRWPNHRAQRVHCAYRLDVNVYRGIMRLQLLLETIEPIS